MRFEVDIVKNVPMTTTVEVEASTWEEAVQKAIEEAKTYEGIGYFNEWPNDAEYDFTECRQIQT